MDEVFNLDIFMRILRMIYSYFYNTYDAPNNLIKKQNNTFIYSFKCVLLSF